MTVSMVALLTLQCAGRASRRVKQISGMSGHRLCIRTIPVSDLTPDGMRLKKIDVRRERGSAIWRYRDKTAAVAAVGRCGCRETERAVE